MSKTVTISSIIEVLIVIGAIVGVSMIRTTPTNISPSVNSGTSTTVADDSEKTLIDALNTSYGGTAVQKDTHWAIEWYPSQSDLNQWSAISAYKSSGLSWTQSTKLTTVMLGKVAAIENGVNKEYILTQTDDGCESHPCPAMLGAAVLIPQNGVWKMESVQKNLSTWGSFGQLPTPTIISIGKDRPSFQLNVTSIYQGYSQTEISIYANVGGTFREVLDIQGAGADNLQSGDDISYGYALVSNATKIEAIPGSGEFYDLRAMRTGTEQSKDKKTAVNVNEVTTYHFDGAKYAKVAGQ